jgi:hypothetical protein
VVTEAFTTGLVSLAVTVGAVVISTTGLTYLTNRTRRAEKVEDWARQDAVAAQAAEAARLLLEQQRATTAAAERVARVTAETSADAAEQLKAIHTLVNSDMTAARSGELAQNRLLLVALKKVIELDRAAGRPPTKDDREAVTGVELRIAELEAVLADRLAAQRKVEAAAAAAAEGGA